MAPPTKRIRARKTRGGRIALAALLAALLSATLPLGCADRKAPEEPEIGGHPAEFNQAASVDFHGTRIRERGVSACRTCHGEDLTGGPGLAGCYDCHDGPGGHPPRWARPDAPVFHGAAVEAEGLGPCKGCHGLDLAGGWSGVSCSECHAGGAGGHPDGWMTPDATSFHGRLVHLEGVIGCARCHGFPPSRGTAGVSCADCHI
jgi:hypothetical protein